jgi:integrase
LGGDGTHRVQRAALPPCATQLLNAGCRVTSIQKFLGHKRLNSTMIYARVHDRTVADDYYAAMDRIEQRLERQYQQSLPRDQELVRAKGKIHLS